jgi:thiol-disulfide isomerase/thioredoxin
VSRGSGNNTAAAGVEQTRPVQVVGDSLPQLQTGTDPAVGTLIPELHGASFDGTPVDVTRTGQAKLILFVAHWCPHCQREVPLLASYLRSNPLPTGFELVTVATATSPDQPNYPPSTWLANVQWPSPVLADSSDSAAAQAFGLPGYPYFVAVDSTGHVVARTSGEITTDQFMQLAHQALGVD